MERLHGLRGARFMFVVTLLLGSNLLTFMYSTSFFTNRCDALVSCADTRRLQTESFRTNLQPQVDIFQHSYGRSPQSAPQLSSQNEYKIRELASVIEDNIAGLNDKYSYRIRKDAAETLLSQDADYKSRELASLHEDNNNIANLNHRYSQDIEASEITRAPVISTRIISAESSELPSIDNMSDCAPCQCNNTVTVFVSSNENNPSNHDHSPSYSNQRINSSDPNLKTIFVITPTYRRSTQKIDLTMMCNTLMHVPQIVWIIIEDAPKPTSLVTQLLSRCHIKTVHLTVPTSPAYQPKKGARARTKPRGVEQRNAGLSWLRQHYGAGNCNGVVYFGDDDNKYDLRLFDDIRRTKHASVWKVAWSGGLLWEGPTCHGGHATSWHSAFAATKRALPVDMAAFAVDLCEVVKLPRARVGVTVQGHASKLGFLESDFLQHFTSRSKVECRGSEKEAYVWHSHTAPPSLHFERRARSSLAIET